MRPYRDAKDLFLNIPFPRPTANINRGSRNKTPETTPKSVRFTTEDVIMVQKIAAELGMTFSEFCKWTVYYAAVAVMKDWELRDLMDERSVRAVQSADIASNIDYSEYK